MCAYVELVLQTIQKNVWPQNFILIQSVLPCGSYFFIMFYNSHSTSFFVVAENVMIISVPTVSVSASFSTSVLCGIFVGVPASNPKWNGEFHGGRPRPTEAVVPMGVGGGGTCQQFSNFLISLL
jgi:hypothetical protein